ncbi:NUDIX hydrolase [Ancylobacter lacus]|uniref:NUDIX hydrolase n=1 Tax=Ancylobacter lacus TaxID=2579970 RepID=UPI001BCFDE92|nr:NUDIX hydrolase [Ancylobacter lacus]MBS7539779.1 NUDIX hydrolase [Ancylobacter lacus]
MRGALAPEIEPLARLDLIREEGPPAFAQANAAAIAAHFDTLKAANPALWNGRVLLLARHAIAAGALTGAYRECDFAAFMWWRDMGFPDPTLRNAFAMGALRGADGAFILGVMAGWTANPGRIYFAAGTPDPSDVTADGRVDLAGSVMRELGEETGLGAADVSPAPGWDAVLAGPRIALMRQLVAHEEAEAVAARIRALLATQERPELDGVVVVRGENDLSPAMPDFIVAYLRSMWKRGG